MGGYRFNITENVDIEPLTLLKTTENWNPQGDFTVKVYYDELFWGGLSYRTNQSVILLLGVRIDNLYFGYSFDWAFSEIGHFNYGSHEVILSVKLQADQTKTDEIRQQVCRMDLLSRFPP